MHEICDCKKSFTYILTLFYKDITEIKPGVSSLGRFLIGFLSQSNTKEGYIHFAGVHPDYRGIGLGEYLYEQFYKVCKQNKRDTIRSCTSPVNKGSIEFHKRMGFQVERGNPEIDGI